MSVGIIIFCTVRDGHESVVGVVKIVDGKTDLLQVVTTLHPPCGFACRLYGGKQQCDEHADDGDDDEQFDERETSRMSRAA